MLGDRLMSCENPILKKQAQICYICSGNLNKLIEVSDGDIQEMVELVVIMQKALELQGIREVQLENKIATVLSQYAEMLAAEGDLEAALNYLGNSQDQRVSMLRDRLCKALNYMQEQRHVTKSAAQNYYYEQTRRASQGPCNPLQQSLQQTTPVQNWNTNPLKQSYGAPTNQPFNTQPSQLYGMPPPPPPQSQVQSIIYDQYSTSHYNQITSQPPIAQPLPPPPPTSGSNLSGSRPSSVGPQSRTKYLIDPSVKSTPSYGQNTFPSSNPLYNSQQISPVPGYPQQNSYQPQVPIPSNVYPNQPSNFMNNPKESEPYKPLQPSIMSPLQNVPQSQMYDPIRSQPTSQMQTYGNENTYQLPPQPSGWNDPPIAKSSRTQVNYIEFTQFHCSVPISRPYSHYFLVFRSTKSLTFRY